MPLEIHAEESIVEIEPSEIEGAKGPTLEAETIAGFLRTVDFTPLFDFQPVRESESKTVKGTKFVRHDGHTEWSNCGKCGKRIDWANNVMFGPGSGRDRDDTSCPYCGSADTDWMEPRGKRESISGEDVVQVIDERDLLAMFKLHLREEFPRDTLSERTILSRFSDLMEGSNASTDAHRMVMIQEVVKRARFRKRRYSGLPSTNKGVTHWRESNEEVDIPELDGMLVEGVAGRHGDEIYGVGRDGSRMTGGPASKPIFTGAIYRAEKRQRDNKLTWRRVGSYGGTRAGHRPSGKFLAELQAHAAEAGKPFYHYRKVSHGHSVDSKPHFMSAFEAPRMGKNESIVIDFPGFAKVNEAWPSARNYKTRKNVKKRIGMKTVSANAWKESEEGEFQDEIVQEGDTYKIVRHFMHKGNRVIDRGLTKEEAQDHCKHPETSSRTATSSTAKARTKKHGPWFDGYSQESVEGASLASKLCESMQRR